MKQSIYNQDRCRTIAAEVAVGLRSLDDIGAGYGISGERVRQIAQREGVSRNHQKVPGQPRLGQRTKCRTCGARIRVGMMRDHRIDAGHTVRPNGTTTQRDRDLIREFYQRGLGYVAIGEVVGLHPQNVKYHVVRMGLSRHSVGQYRRDGSVQRLKDEMRSRWGHAA